jgi:glycosyltransferase involved in cell wall biosynthesis
LLNNSEAGAAGYERWIGLRRRSIRVVRNAFMPDHMPRPPANEVTRFRASLGATPGRPLVGAVMRLSREKDPALWLATAAEIVKVRPDVVFGLCGYGPLQDEMAEQAAALGLRGCVQFPGPVSDLGLVYAAFDVVLLTSIVEGLPNVLIEAQAAGCPVVTADVGGAREAVAEGITGIVVRERSARELAHAVLSILADPSWRERTQAQGPAFVDRNFGFKRMIDETIEVYGTEHDSKKGVARLWSAAGTGLRK